MLTMAGQKIQAITRFHLDELYPRFGLAESLPEPAAQPKPRLAGLAGPQFSSQRPSRTQPPGMTGVPPRTA